MKRKIVRLAALGLALVLFAAGCGKDGLSEIPPTDIAMQTVTQNDVNHYIDFQFSVPEDWLTTEYAVSIAAAYPPEAENAPSGIKNPRPWELLLCNYQFENAYWCSTQGKQQAYRDLFEGKTDAYKTLLNDEAAREFGASAEGTTDDISSMMDILDMLTREPPTEPVTHASETYVTAFDCQLYEGKHGRIAYVTYTITAPEETRQMVDCVREDIPYVVRGGFDDAVEPCSGDIALYVADSLEVTEHFTMEDGKIEKAE